MSKKICLYGASGHGKVIKEIAKNRGVEVMAFFDDNPSVQTLQGIPVFKTDEIANFSNIDFVISIGNNSVRKKIATTTDINYGTLIDHSSIISSSVNIDEGSVIMPSAIINTSTNIGKHVIINTACLVEHDCIIEDYAHISPNATITGNVAIGEGTHIGAGAVVIPGIKIGKWATIGAGAVVINDIPDYAVVVGNPAKIIKYKK